MAWIYKRGDSRNWWVGWRVGQKSFFRSTGSAEKSEAQRQLAEVRVMFEAHRAGSLTQEVFESLTGRTIPKKSLVSELDDWIAECGRTTSHETVERYRTIAEAFKGFCGATERGPLLSEITSDHVRTFLSQRREKRGASTVNLERKILTVFFRREVAANQLKKSPTDGVRGERITRHEKRQRRAFTVAELRDIYAKAELLGDFWRYLVLAGIYTGQRMGDLVCLTWGAVDFEAKVIRLFQRKTDNRVIVPLQPTLCALLWQLRERIGRAGAREQDPIWPEESAAYIERGAGQFSNQFYDRILVPCGIMPPRAHRQAKGGRDAQRDASPVSFHSLRHSFVSLLKATGGSQAVAKELAGHSSDAVNDLYTHTAPETLAKAIAALPEVTK